MTFVARTTIREQFAVRASVPRTTFWLTSEPRPE
jgi:hypothetical protein